MWYGVLADAAVQERLASCTWQSNLAALDLSQNSIVRNSPLVTASQCSIACPTVSTVHTMLAVCIQFVDLHTAPAIACSAVDVYSALMPIVAGVELVVVKAARMR